MIYAIFIGAIALRAYTNERTDQASRLLFLLANAVLVAFFTWAIWFALLFTGTIRLGWLTQWLGTPRLDQRWMRIVFFTPPLAAALVYITVNMFGALSTARR